MPNYLRSIRQSRWNTPDWLAPSPNQIQADALKDLNTKSNLLSVYLAESPQDIDHITIALAATRENVQNLEYALFNDATFQDIGIAISQSPGRTPDWTVNQLHYDLGKLTATQILAVATTVAKGEIRRKQSKDIGRGLRTAIKNGALDTGTINQTLLAKIQ